MFPQREITRNRRIIPSTRPAWRAPEYHRLTIHKQAFPCWGILATEFRIGSGRLDSGQIRVREPKVSDLARLHSVDPSVGVTDTLQLSFVVPRNSVDSDGFLSRIASGNAQHI